MTHEEHQVASWALECATCEHDRRFTDLPYVEIAADGTAFAWGPLAGRCDCIGVPLSVYDVQEALSSE